MIFFVLGPVRYPVRSSGGDDAIMPVDRILTIDEASKVLRVSTREIEKIIREGKLKGKRTAEGWKINERDLAAYQKTTRR